MLDDVLGKLVPEGAASDDIALLALHSPVLSERFRLELPGDPAELVSMRSLLRRWLRHAEGTPQDVAEILTATGEAAANAIEHAGAPAQSPLEIVGTVAGGEVEITVRDHGRWRTEPAMADPARVFITGALGFIGRALGDRFRAGGSELRGVDLRADRERGCV